MCPYTGAELALQLIPHAELVTLKYPLEFCVCNALELSSERVIRVRASENSTGGYIKAKVGLYVKGYA